MGDLWVFNPVFVEWTDLSAMAAAQGSTPSARAFFGMASASGRVFIFGGSSSVGTYPSLDGRDEDTFSFDPATAMWTSIKKGKWSVSSGWAMGLSFEDPTNLGFSPFPRINGELAAANGTDGRPRVYMFGGAESWVVLMGLRSHNDLWSLDPETNVWTEIIKTGAWPSSRLSHGWTSSGSTLYLFGGHQNFESTPAVLSVRVDPMNDLWAFSTHTATWTEFPVTGPSARGGMSFGSLGGLLYVLGGIKEVGEKTRAPKDFWTFSPAEASWEDRTTSVSATPAARGGARTTLPTPTLRALLRGELLASALGGVSLMLALKWWRQLTVKLTSPPPARARWLLQGVWGVLKPFLRERVAFSSKLRGSCSSSTGLNRIVVSSRPCCPVSGSSLHFRLIG